MELSLDELLEKAATGPADRPAFFRRLMQSDVWVAGKPAPDASLVFDPAGHYVWVILSVTVMARRSRL